MRNGAITIGMMVIFVSIIIYIIKNLNSFIELWNKFIKKKIRNVCLVLIAILLVIFIYDNSKEIIENIAIYRKNKEYNKIYEYSEKMKEEETLYYNETYNNEYSNQTYSKPYIFENFEYVEGTYDDGFVIQDMNKNQYVWVPCTNKDIEGIAKLQKKNFVSPVFISKDVCYDEQYEEFLKSALENGGFYISRFEIGIENDLPVSKAGVKVWNNVSREEAKNIISNMYENEKIHCELINGFAYDTTLIWLKNTNEIEKNIIDIQKEKIIYSGRTSYNKIYDFCDNILELSTENFYDNIIVRGFSASEEEMNSGINFSEESRYTIFKDSTNVNLLDGLSFRTILYK